MPAPRLARALAQSGLDLGRDAEEILDEADESGAMPLVVTLHDGRYTFTPSLFSGRVLTHRVTGLEVEHDVLDTEPDLAAALEIAADDERFRRLVDGSKLTLAMPGFDDPRFDERGLEPGLLPGGEYALLPPGLLAGVGVRPGDLVGVTLTDAGWSFTRVDGATAPDPAHLKEQVRRHMDRAGREPYPLTPLVWNLCANTDLFTTAEAPLSELLKAWGLERHGDLVAPEGFDMDRWRIDELTRHIASTYRIDEDDAFAVAVLSEQYRTVERLLGTLGGLDEDEQREVIERATDDDDADDDAPAVDATEVLGELAASLADADVAEALLAETLGAGTESAGALGVLAESLLNVAPEEALPAARWLLAKAHDRRGDLAAAEEALRDVVAAAPLAPALRDLARFASDRGQAAEALDLLRRAGVGPDDAEVALLTRMSSLPAHDLGRNQPCWCGSGRKYKACHLGNEELPLAERAAWLYQKAGAYVQDGPWREDIIEVAVERARWSLSPAALYGALQDGLVIDAVLFEGGAFEAFLAARGSLLPVDERALGEQWLLLGRSVHEVTAVRPGTSVSLRDLRTGDAYVVRERTASRMLTVGTLLCTRVVPAGDTWQLFGGAEPVALHEREALMELLDAAPGPAELVAFLSRRFAPPTLTNTEGEPLELHEAQVRPADPAGVAARLDATYRRVEGAEDEDVDGAWHELVPGRDQIRTFLRQEDGHLTVSTNSTARLERVLTVLRDADPDLEVVVHERRTAAEMAELAERFPDVGGERPAPDVPDEAVAEAIADLMRRYEDDWLDESIPALAGLTPRQAVADPTRRDDVVRLLRSFPPPTPQSMDRDRLAEALGIGPL